MNFLKKLYNKNKSFVPTPTKTVSGYEPIVVQAVECLFSNERYQKSALEYIRRERSPKMQLALLFYSEGNIDKLRAASSQSHPHFWMDEISPIFSTMKEAEEWVKSISKSHPVRKPETNKSDGKTGMKKKDPFEGNIPTQFRQRFGGDLFSHCSFCSKELLKENTSYMINKIYRQNECVYEIAYCFDCLLEMRKTYSKKSIKEITNFFPSEDELIKRRQAIILLMADKNKVLTKTCVTCGTKKDTKLDYHEYAYCENDKLGYGIYPYMMCESCVLEIYNKLSSETIQAYHRFMETHFGLPPEFPSGKEKVDVSILFI